MIDSALVIANSYDFFVVDFEEYAINSPNSVVARLSSEALSSSLLADSQRCDAWRGDLLALFRGLVDIDARCVTLLNDERQRMSLAELFDKRETIAAAIRRRILVGQMLLANSSPDNDLELRDLVTSASHLFRPTMSLNFASCVARAFDGDRRSSPVSSLTSLIPPLSESDLATLFDWLTELNSLETARRIAYSTLFARQAVLDLQVSQLIREAVERRQALSGDCTILLFGGVCQLIDVVACSGATRIVVCMSDRESRSAFVRTAIHEAVRAHGSTVEISASMPTALDAFNVVLFGEFFNNGNILILKPFSSSKR